jgi:hypothetical protein
MTMRQTNEEFIAEFSDWCSQHKFPSAEIEEQVSCISKLAGFMAPVPHSKMTKAVLQDFYLEELMRPQTRESRTTIVRALISLDAFRADKRRTKKSKARP